MRNASAVLRIAAVAAVGLSVFTTPAYGAHGYDIVNMAKRFWLRPYKFGASMSEAPWRFDCSSFTKYVYARCGVYLPRDTRQQSYWGRWAWGGDLKWGDLLFFDTTYSRPGIDHVAIYTGNGYFVHATPSGGVRFNRLGWGTWWSRHYVTARRILR